MKSMCVRYILTAYLFIFYHSVLQAQVPGNDLCSNATLLTSSTTCNNIAGTLLNSTQSSPNVSSTCGGTPGGDVWYKFVAQTAYPVISLSSIGNSMRNNNNIQLLSGTCGSFTTLACVTSTSGNTNSLNTATNPGGAGLTPGTTYYVRIYSTSNPINSGTWTYNICITDPVASSYDYGKSYVNISKNNGGGTVNPGDTLEIRSTLVIQNVNSSTLDSLSFVDTLYPGGGIKFVPGSLALQTNEGKIYKSFTDAVNDDAGYQYTSGSDTIIRINFGAGATATARGRLTGTSKPKVFSNACIIMATYRVVVYAGYGSTINLGKGMITMKDANTGISKNLYFSSRNVIVYSSPGLCPNAVSATNAIGGDFNGTFGAPSGNAPLARNRGTSTNVPSYIYRPFSSSGGPNDYYYGIANNTSATYTTSTTWAKPESHRVFNVWDITGDHTGATNTTKGNPPCDTTKPVSPTNPCGYMLVINSAYKTDTAFQYTVTNLCPNTYYEVSAWLKNICYKCGCDSNGTGASNGGYIPFAPNDSSGVQPNLTFDIDGIDYYTTGNLPYLGIYPATQSGSDSTNKWVKKGFTYLTGQNQTSLTLSIRNNAPGGGGNDWAMDDIAFTTCTPSMTFTPTSNPIVCKGNLLSISCTVTTYFNNYKYFKWQRSVDGGSTWSDVSAIDSATLNWNGSTWEFTSNYPPFIATQADSATRYRLVVATTVSNLSNSNCLYTDQTNVVYVTVYNCDNPLTTHIISFSGKTNNDEIKLNWTTSKEDEPLFYEIEQSFDGRHFSTIATVNSHADYDAGLNYYSYSVPWIKMNPVFFRIKLKSMNRVLSYSSVIRFTPPSSILAFNSVINPFNAQIKFEITSDNNYKAEVELVNSYGVVVRKSLMDINSGINNMILDKTSQLPSGIYILRVKTPQAVIQRTIMKENN
jgi:hypothetical protein